MYNYETQNQVSNYSDMWGKYNDSLNYQMTKCSLDVQKNAAMLGQKLWFQEQQMLLQNYWKNYLALTGSTVYSDSHGDIMYAITNADDKKVVARKLMNVSGYKARWMVCYYPHAFSILRISWYIAEKVRYVYWNPSDEKPSGAFLRRLKAKGLVLSVSGRTEHMAADALLAYSIITAAEMEIPFEYGWGLTGEGEWHFADDDELTMTEVLKYV